MMAPQMGKRNDLDKVDLSVPAEPTKRKNSANNKRIKKTAAQLSPGSRIGRQVKKGARKPPPVPKNKSLEEIEEMDPDDPAFKNPEGMKRVVRNPDDWKDMVRADKQRRANERRAKVRKGEAKVVKAVEILENPSTAKERRDGIYDEEKAIAEGILGLDDWDDEELIRGYRRNRNGKFGPPPKAIPREIQMELFRRLVARGDRKLKTAYIKSIEGLIFLSEESSSDKVRLEAIRELMNRVVGKVPDRVHVAQEQPWEQFLADAIVPMPVGDEDDSAPMGEAVDRPALPIRPYMEEPAP